MRVDKWLWHTRFFKTRGRASERVAAGHVRVNGDRIGKISHKVGPGDVLTFPQERDVRVVRVLALTTRRGPAAEAQSCYEDLTPERVRDDSAPKPDRGRLDKKARRQARLSKEGRLE